MRIRIMTLGKAARAIYSVSCQEADDGECPIPSFDRLAPNTKDLYLRMAKAAAEAIDRDYPFQRAASTEVAGQGK